MKLPSFKIISAGIWVVFCLILSISFAFANNIYILQSGDSVDLNVTQDGQNNEIEGLNDSGYAEVKIYSGGIFCILNENTNPIIKNVFPNNNSYYNANDLNTISFNLIDSQSNIDYNSINILLNNRTIYFDYIPYRDYVRATLFDVLDKGENILQISINDNIGNKSEKEIKFFIK